MSKVKLLQVFCLCTLLNACALIEPFVDRRREAGVSDMTKLYIGESKTDAPAICYNKLYTKYETVKKMADEECVKQKTGSHATPVKQTLFTCRLLVPNHLYFKCEK